VATPGSDTQSTRHAERIWMPCPVKVETTGERLLRPCDPLRQLERHALGTAAKTLRARRNPSISGPRNPHIATPQLGTGKSGIKPGTVNRQQDWTARLNRAVSTTRGSATRRSHTLALALRGRRPRRPRRLPRLSTEVGKRGRVWVTANCLGLGGFLCHSSTVLVTAECVGYLAIRAVPGRLCI
jgi:hypothetical protein